MAIEFLKAAGLVGEIASATKGLLNAREEAKVNQVAIQLQGIVLDLQSEMLMIQSDYQNVLRSRDELEKKLAKQEDWNKEGGRYHLQNVAGNFVYALDLEKPSAEPPHWLCANCYQQNKKSILQNNPYPHWLCPSCKTQIVIMSFPARKDE